MDHYQRISYVVQCNIIYGIKGLFSKIIYLVLRCTQPTHQRCQRSELYKLCHQLPGGTGNVMSCTCTFCDKASGHIFNGCVVHSQLISMMHIPVSTWETSICIYMPYPALSSDSFNFSVKLSMIFQSLF